MNIILVYASPVLHFGTDGAKALAEGLKHCTNLRTLNVISNSIGTDGTKALAEGLKHCTNLRTLNVISNSIVSLITPIPSSPPPTSAAAVCEVVKRGRKDGKWR